MEQRQRKCLVPLVLRKSQWEHLKKQAGQLQSDEDATKFHEKREYYNALNAQSKEWKKTWPDTVEGCLAQVEARKERQRQRDLAFMKTFKKKAKKMISTHEKAVAEAKLKLFHSSNDGQQLASAVRESKAIEEREAQIELNKLIKQKANEYDEAMTIQIASMENNLYDFAKKQDEALKKRKQADKEQAETNKKIHEYNVYQAAKAKEEERLGELEDARLQQLNLDYEKHEMDHCKERAIEESKQYDKDQHAFRAEKEQRDQEDDALVEVWAKYRDRVWCREKRTWEKIIKGRGESDNYKQAYEMAGKALQADKTNYETFVENGIKKLEKSQSKEEEKIDVKKLQKSQEYRKQIREEYKMALEMKDILKHCNKCACEKQSLFTKPAPVIKKNIIGGDTKDTHKPESFLAPYSRLSAELQARSVAPPPCTGLQARHQYFAEQAAAAIRECKHKYMARKVVDNYKKSYDCTTLPVPDD